MKPKELVLRTQTFTYQARPRVSEDQNLALVAYADLHERVERKLFGAISAGGSAGKLKPIFMREYGLTARQYNAIAIGLRGKMASVKERQSGLIKEAELRVVKAKKVIGRLAKTEPGTDQLHLKKRRLATLQARLEAMRTDRKADKARICFGSKKLFRAQFYLEENNYSSLADWKQDWHQARSSQFFVIGSKDESGGCQGCVATRQADGSLNLKLRLPDAIATEGKYLSLSGLQFAYGQYEILAALANGTAISYRFVRDQKSWRVMVSTSVKAPQIVSKRVLGAIGIDINGDHLAVAEVDRYGNYVRGQKVSCLTYGKTKDQSKAQVGEAVKQVIQLAFKSGKPVVIEKLDFGQKKAELETSDPVRSRQLSVFAYSQISQSIHSAGFRQGIEVLEVNPAFTSVIGAVNHAQQLGISIHLGAALAIARRGMGLSERPAVRRATVPVRNGDHVTFLLPVRNRRKHVWSAWSATRTRLKAVTRVHVRSGKAKANPAPLARRLLSANWILPVKPRQANRLDNCSPGVVSEDLVG